MKKYYSSIFIALLLSVSVFSQNKLWEQNVTVDNSKSVSEKPSKQITFKFNSNVFLNQLVSVPKRFSNKNSNSIISLPNELGVFESYKIYESSNFAPILANKYPQIKSYIGIGSVSGNSARISYSPSQGLNVFITSLDRATTIIKPLDIKNNIYSVFSRNNSSQDISDFECSTMESVMRSTQFRNKNGSNFNADDQNLRLYRLAVSTTGEYSQYFLDGTEVDDTERIAKVLASINTALVRINGIFERDFSATMQLVANNDSVIFLNAASDPYSGVSNAALQNTLDSTIGDANYDVGHLFAFEGSIYGNAGCIACVCTSGAKGQAYTVHSAPDSDNFYMIASHEFGHQFGGWHVQSSSNCRSSAGLQEVEPGSGSTIMGYAGICPANVQNTPDDYFNYVDIRDVSQWIINDSSCAVLIPLTNNAPTVSAGVDYTIPFSTAFVLEGQGNDLDTGDMLSFCWEENDPEDPFSSAAPSSTRVQGPMFRSKLPISSPDRYMPQLSDVVNGNITPTWEVVPSIARTMDFVLTVRDNALNGGQTASDEMTVTVDGNSGPFSVTSQSTVENWDVGTNVTVTWDVANTNLAPVNATNVDLFLSIDGGYTYPYTLLSNTLNDGTETIIVPNVPSTTQARVMVKGANNIFYALNASDINIQASEFVMSFVNPSLSICQPNDAVYNFTYNTFLGFNETTTFSVDNLPAGVTASFNPATATTNATNVVLTISNTGSFAIGDYDIVVKGNALNVEKSAQLSLSIFNNNINPPTLLLPANNATGIDLTEVLTWQPDNNTINFEIEIATDINFTNIIDTATTIDNFYNSSSLDYNTTYFWRVRSINECLTTTYSSVFEFLTSCIAPTNIIVTNALINTAEISWTEMGSASTWEVEIVAVNTTPTGSGISTTTNPYLATNLNSTTEYDVYVRSICSGTNFSSWEGPVSFTTAADFCSGDNFYDTGGINGNYSNSENYTTVIAPSAGFNSVTVQFNSFSTESCCDALSIYDGPDTSYPFLGSYGGTNSPGNITSSNTSGSLTFVFTSDGSVTYSGWDATVICESISCPNPSNLQISNITTTTSDLSWLAGNTETQWEVEYGQTGFAQGTGVLSQTTVNTDYPLTGLTAFTAYDVYVRANCGANPGDDDSIWIGPINFTTAADFCSGDHFYDTGGVNGNYSNGENYTTTIAPSVGFNSITVQFNSFSTEGCCDFLTIYDGPDNTYPFIGSYGGANNPGSITATDSSGALTFVFTSDGSVTSSGWDATVICESISCPNPSNLQISNITATTSDLSWLAGNTETQWEVEYGQSGFTQGTGVLSQTSVNTNYPITGLTASTAYDFYVRANCGANPGDDDSSWIGPINFTTLCGAIVAPFYEDFSSSTTPNCWQEYGSEPWNYNTFADYQAQNAGDHTIGGGTNYAWIDGSTPNGPGQISNLRTVPIDISQLIIPTLKFSIYSYNTDDFTYNTLNVIVHDDNAVSQNVLQLQASTGGWMDYSIDLNSIISTNSNIIEIEFIIEENSPGSPYYNDILIDDIQIIETPTCPEPSNLQISNITATTSDLSWLAGNTETQWEVEYGQSGFTQGTGVLSQTSVNTNYPITGLTASTAYDFYVRANCGTNPGDDDSSWIGPINFTTLCGAIVAPFYEDFSSSTTPNCWQEYGSESWNYNTFADYEAQNAGDHTIGGGTNYAWIDGSTPNGPGQISNLRTVPIDISQLIIPTLKFSIYSYNTDDFTYNTLNVIVHDDNAVSQNVLQLQASTGGWMDYTIDLSTVISTNTSTIELEFIIEENSIGSPYYNDILIDDIYIDNLSTLGINEFDLEGFSFYPNPVKDLLYLNHTSAISKIEIFSVLGQSLFSSTPQKNNIQIDMSNYSEGSYFVRVEVDGRFKTLKVLKE